MLTGLSNHSPTNLKKSIKYYRNLSYDMLFFATEYNFGGIESIVKLQEFYFKGEKYHVNTIC